MKNEDKTTPLEKLGYGLKYTLAISTAILAMCALCFIFISVTTYFAPPLQPIFDQERLGQLGDFLGGTLNPIFGFATVCLLLWSVFIQRKELSLTRDELKKSAAALTDQVKLATDEYNRKHYLELLNSYKTLFYKNLYKKENYKPYFFFENDNGDLKRSESPEKPANLFDVYRQIIAAENTYHDKNYSLMIKLALSFKHPKFYTVNLIIKTEDEEYPSGNEIDLQLFLEMRRCAINTAHLSNNLMNLDSDKVIKKIVFDEAFEMLKIQSYFISKEDNSFINSLPNTFQKSIASSIQDRKFNYHLGASLLGLINRE